MTARDDYPLVVGRGACPGACYHQVCDEARQRNAALDEIDRLRDAAGARLRREVMKLENALRHGEAHR
jgi:hypothetical protein